MSFNLKNLPELLDAAQQLAIQAGAEIMNIYNGEFDVTAKQDNTPLTAADLAAHRLIRDGLTRLTPDLPVLSEESREVPFDERECWQTYWLVDPLDGTKEFIKRNGEFTVNIALIHEHEPVLGVVSAPAKELYYFACRGHGAYKQLLTGKARPIQVRRPMPKCPTVAGSRSHAGDSLGAFLEKLGKHELISMGSALKSCLVAEGQADIYPRFGPTSEWDTAAAQCVVEEAGGYVSDLDLAPLRYNTKASLLNPHFLVIGDTGHDWAQYL